MYIILCGEPPFFGDNTKEIYAAVKKGEFSFEGKRWGKISKEAK